MKGKRPSQFSIALLKVSEKHEELQAGLEDIYSEAKDIDVVTIEGQVYRIQFYLGGNFKAFSISLCAASRMPMLSMHVCGVKQQGQACRHIINAVVDSSKGARSVEEIMENARSEKQTKIATTANANHCFLSYQLNE